MRTWRLTVCNVCTYFSANSGHCPHFALALLRVKPRYPERQRDRESTCWSLRSQQMMSTPCLNMVRFCRLGPSLLKPGRANRIQKVPSSALAPSSESLCSNRPWLMRLCGVSVRNSPSTVATHGNTYTTLSPLANKKLKVKFRLIYTAP